ncbi:MAG: hypothetical protein NUV32_08960 [Exilispira sp.]|jgi:hypothetical protein|nr:hypothetical protein [Exilispira sp.]
MPKKTDSEKQILLEIYKTYHDSIEKVAEKRQNTNSFFLTLNTGILELIGFLFQKDAPVILKPLYLILPIIGIISGVFWLKLVNSYRQLNKGKFDFLYELEEQLPFDVYNKEWNKLGKGENPKIYKPLTSIEKFIPKTFIVLYGLFTIYLFVIFVIEIKVIKVV